MTKDQEVVVKKILKLAEDIYNVVPINIPMQSLSSDLTVAQLRVLLALQNQRTSNMSTIASTLGVTLPTATGIVDNMVKKDLVVRLSDPDDRRVVICKLSAEGQNLINKIWLTGQFEMQKLLDGLTTEELEKIENVVRILLNNEKRKSINLRRKETNQE